MNELKDSAYEDFMSILTVNSIKQFYYECKKKHIDLKSNKKTVGNNGSRISKDAFNQIMQIIFGKEFRKDEIPPSNNYYLLRKEDNKEKIFNTICDMLFNRFKSVQCEVKSERNKTVNENYFYLNEINSESNEIDTYELSCALSIFPKIEFKEKMRLLFDITDVDEDGYINEAEIKSMIFAINFIFCDEDSALKSNSSIINQSLSTIKSQIMFNSIVRYPGGLYKVIAIEKYINFDQFYNAITKLDNYKYTIIPTFINLKNCLMIKKSEPEFEMDRKNLNEFLSITNEIVTNIKKTNSEIVKDSKDIKKLIDAKAENNMENLIKKKRNYIDENRKKVTSKKNNSNKNSIDTDQQLDKTHSNNDLPIISSNPKSSQGKEKKYVKASNNINNIFLHDNYNINYNRIINLEAQPGKIKVKDNQNLIPMVKDHLLSINKTDSSGAEKESRNYKNTNSKTLHITNKEINEKKNGFVSYNDIMNEVQTLSNKNHTAYNEDTEEIIRYLKEVRTTGAEIKNCFKDTGTNSIVSFGKFKYA